MDSFVRAIKRNQDVEDKSESYISQRGTEFLDKFQHYIMGDLYKRFFQSAVKVDWDEVFELYKKEHIDFNDRITRSEDTIFHLAAYNKLEVIFERLVILLVGGDDLTRSSLELVNMNKDTALHIAASVGSLRMCRSIIDTAELTKLLSCRNKDDETPLFSAVLHGHKDVFLYLHSICGPDIGYVYCSRKDGENILHCAITEEYHGEYFLV